MNTYFPPRSSRLVSRLTLSLASLTLGLFLTGCPGGKPSAEVAAEGGSGSGAADKVVIRGSNTIGEKLAPLLIAEFKKDHPGIAFDLEAKATGYGLAALRTGQCDLASASRAAIPADLTSAQQYGVEMAEYIIGAYSVAVVVHPGNGVNNLSREQVHGIFTGTIRSWKEVGGPDAPIRLYIRDSISGTHLGFKDLALDNEDYAESAKMLMSYDAIAQAVAADPQGIGYTSLNLASAGVKALTVGGVAATKETVHSRTYPYGRVLRFYTNKARESARLEISCSLCCRPGDRKFSQRRVSRPSPDLAFPTTKPSPGAS